MRYQSDERGIASLDELHATIQDFHALRIPEGLSDTEIRAWASTCLLAAPFTNSVLKMMHTRDPIASLRMLANTYGLGLTEARRDMETVQNWLAFFVPDTIA